MNKYKKERLIEIGSCLGTIGLVVGLWVGAGYIGSLPSKNQCTVATINTNSQKYGSLTFVKCKAEEIDQVIQNGKTIFIGERYSMKNYNTKIIPPELNKIGLEAFALQEKTIKTLDKIVEEKKGDAKWN